MTVRRLLFLPADRPAMAAKLPAIDPDLEVLDLEYAVASVCNDVTGLETSRLVPDCRELPADVTPCYFGAEGYISDLGGRRAANGTEVLLARSQVVLGSRSTEHALPPVKEKHEQTGIHP